MATTSSNVTNNKPITSSQIIVTKPRRVVDLNQNIGTVGARAEIAELGSYGDKKEAFVLKDFATCGAKSKVFGSGRRLSFVDGAD